MELRQIKEKDDRALAKIIRYNFEKHDLAIPGTVYYDPELDHLSRYYTDKAGSEFYVLTDDKGEVAGSVGFAEYPGIKDCAELQKLYLSDSVKGMGYGKKLVTFIEERAKAAGYRNLYIETNSKFSIAVQMYKKMGFTEIERPLSVQHKAMNVFFIKNL